MRAFVGIQEVVDIEKDVARHPVQFVQSVIRIFFPLTIIVWEISIGGRRIGRLGVREIRDRISQLRIDVVVALF
jgi:hypothetical protein